MAYSRCSVIAGSHSNLTPPHPMSLKKEEMVSSFLPTAWPAININCPYMVPSRRLVTAYFTRFLRVRCSCFEVGAFWQQPLTPSLFFTLRTISSLGAWGSHGYYASPIPTWNSVLHITQEQDECPGNNDFTFGHCIILGREEPPFALLCRAVSWLRKVDICVETFHLKCLMLTFAPGFFPFLGVPSGAGPRKVLWN